MVNVRAAELAPGVIIDGTNLMYAECYSVTLIILELHTRYGHVVSWSNCSFIVVVSSPTRAFLSQLRPDFQYAAPSISNDTNGQFQ